MNLTHIAEIREDREPTRRALAMAEAILQHLEDLEQDDPGDEDVSFEDATTAAEELVNALRHLTRRDK